MNRDPQESDQRLQKLRLILRTMERAVDEAKFRRTAPETPVATAGPVLASNSEIPNPVRAESEDRTPHGRGRDIPGPESLPRAKARPKGYGGFGDGQSTFGRTG